MQEKAWYIKYQPTNIDELIFDNSEHKTLMQNSINNKNIDGNILFYGRPGLGKSISAKILINNILEDKLDLLEVLDPSASFIREEVQPFLEKQPISNSNKKIIYIEEFDKLSKEAFNELKRGFRMEKYQNNTSFVCCTNYINKIEKGVLDRFNYKINFSGKNIQDIFDRLKFILNNEKANFDETQLKEFLIKNKIFGIRELINQLQRSYYNNNNTIDFSTINNYSNIDHEITNLFFNIVNTILDNDNLDLTNKKLCYIKPEDSIIAQSYKNLYTIICNNININYDQIFYEIIESTNFIPIKTICAKYADNLDFKKYPHIHFLACYAEIIQCIIDI
jgi:DNA polymerase III delta prime subunit